MKDILKSEKRQAVKQEVKERLKQMFKNEDEYVALRSCLITNAQDRVIGLNFDKLSSIYLKYFPTVYNDDNNLYFQYSESMGVWNKITPTAIIKHFKRIVRRLGCVHIKLREHRKS